MKKTIDESEMPLLKPKFIEVAGEQRWCCGAPGCRYALAVVKSFKAGTALELPAGYNVKAYREGRGVYGPLHGYAKPAPPSNLRKLIYLKSHGDKIMVDDEGRAVGQGRDFPRTDTLPIFIICPIGHAVHRIEHLRQA